MIVPHWLLYAWFALAGLSTLYVAWDNFVRKNPEETVMKWGWVLVTLYMGPLGLALYVHSDKEPAPGTHEEFIRPLWKQGMHRRVGVALAFEPFLQLNHDVVPVMPSCSSRVPRG